MYLQIYLAMSLINFIKQLEALREKLGMESQQLGRTVHLHDQATTRVRILEDERNMLETKVHKLESELNAMEQSRDNLRKDKANVSINLPLLLYQIIYIRVIIYQK